MKERKILSESDQMVQNCNTHMLFGQNLTLRDFTQVSLTFLFCLNVGERLWLW
jgi:hypothetical protein